MARRCLACAWLLCAAAAQPDWKNFNQDLSHAPSCAPVLDAEVPKAGTVGFVFGALAASAIYWIKKQRDERFEPGKSSHPREWAVWTRVDRKRKGFVTRKDIRSGRPGPERGHSVFIYYVFLLYLFCLRSLCYRFESDEHADHLSRLLDPYGMDFITFRTFIRHFKAHTWQAALPGSGRADDARSSAAQAVASMLRPLGLGFHCFTATFSSFFIFLRAKVPLPLPRPEV